MPFITVLNHSAFIFKQIKTSIFLTLLALSVATASESYTQTPLKLKASEVLPPGVLKGLNYQVDEYVVNDGLINIYSITSDFGEFEAEGIAELRMRIAEIKAMSLMKEMEKKEVFGDALKEGVKAPFKGVAALVTEPVETGKAAAKGVGQLFSNIGRSFVSDDPDQDNPASVLVGYDVAKRKFAHELDVNPYSDNELFRKQLGNISKAAVAGGLTPRAAMAAVDSTAVTVARVTGTTKAMKELVRDNPPGKLDKINRKKLESMGVSESLAEAFLDNYTYDPYEETLLVGELEVMQGVAGRDNFLAVANKASEASVARYYRLMAQMMGAYHSDIKNAKEIRNIKGILSLYRDDGVLVLLSPVDHVFWTQRLDNRLNEFETGIKEFKDVKKKEVWITGAFDQKAKQHFEDRGWNVIEQAEKNLIKDS